MRASVLSVVVFAAIVLGSVGVSLATGTGQTQTLILRVTAPDSTRPVSFEGTIVVAEASQPYREIAARTPYEIKVTTTSLHGVLHSKSSDAKLRVQVLEVEGDTVRQLSWVAGSVVALGQDNVLGLSFVNGYRTPGKS